MIKLNRHLTPRQLTPNFVADNTAIFKADGSSVWNIEWLKECLLSLSSSKCAYCECSLTEESKYMEVEHFEDKGNNPDKVLDWDNLLPSCKRCNGSKSTHDVLAEPIINPFIDSPAKHLCFRLYRIKGTDEKGVTSSEVLDLNNTERVVNKRFEVGEALEKLIDEAEDRLARYDENNTVRRRNKVVGIVEGMLTECQAQSIYSATCSTILHSNPTYQRVKERLKALGLWSDELEVLDVASITLALPSCSQH